MEKVVSLVYSKAQRKDRGSIEVVVAGGNIRLISLISLEIAPSLRPLTMTMAAIGTLCPLAMIRVDVRLFYFFRIAVCDTLLQDFIFLQ